MTVNTTNPFYDVNWTICPIGQSANRTRFYKLRKVTIRSVGQTVW